MPQPLKAKLHNKTGRVKSLNRSHVNTSNSSSSSGESTSQNTHSSYESNNRNQNSTESTRSVNENAAHEMTPSSSTGAISDSPVIEQFELELCWCIQTLEKSIELGKLNAKQIQDTEKTIRLLKSKSQPLIKKRQMMQLALGDYRKKMIEEEKKLRKGNTTIEFINNSTKVDKKRSASDPKSANSQCHFVRKSLTASFGDSSFRFKFPVDDISKLSLENSMDENDTFKICDKNTSNENGLDTVPQQSHQIDSNLFIQTKLNNISMNSFKFNFQI